MQKKYLSIIHKKILSKSTDPATEKHLIFAASKFVDFKRPTYWRRLIFVVSQIKAFKVVFYSHRGYS